MILKFKEYINELWSKGVERNITGEERLEDKYKMRDIADEFIHAIYDCAEVSTGELSELWLEFTSFLRLNDNDFKEDEDDLYPDWDLNDVLDVYTLDKFIDLCWEFINGIRKQYKDFNYDEFVKILEQ